jgi:hypothetical protein
LRTQGNINTLCAIVNHYLSFISFIFLFIEIGHLFPFLCIKGVSGSQQQGLFKFCSVLFNPVQVLFNPVQAWGSPAIRIRMVPSA